MSQDLRLFITKKADYVKDAYVDEEIEDFLEFLTKSFNLSENFIISLNLGYKYLLDNELLNLNIFADLMYFPHLCDWLEDQNKQQLGEDDLLSFMLGTTLPDCVIVDNMMDSYFEERFGGKTSDDWANTCLEELNRRKEYINKLDITSELKETIIKFLDDNLIEYINYSEDNSTYYMNTIVSSKILYEISKEEKLNELYKTYFNQWGMFFDDEKQIAYLWYSMLGFEEEASYPVLNLYNFTEVNEALKERFNLEYSPIPQDTIDNIKIYAEYTFSGSTAIEKILKEYETNEEVMF